ncbi:carbamoyltransferase family protein [Solimonas soli]|uniref:carbamoyltransferase family protein n=1 Tax=Solimonas soli TaxID=413479 RepID=UPI000488DFE8|nr:carbamoyltransferase C-terminal domain-containing protein [Solimonas soli]
MITLGINAAFHDCAACLVRDGDVVAAAEDERFTHVKHGKRPLPFTSWQLPFHAVDYCLAEAGVTLADVDRIAYSFDPTLLAADGAPAARETGSVPAWDGVMVRASTLADLAKLPASIRLPLEPSRRARATPTTSPWDPLFLAYVVNAPRQLVDGAPHHLRRRFKGATHEQVAERWRYVEHHLAHEASAFLAAPFEHCAVLTMDGRGERATTSCGVFEHGRYRRLRQTNLPHSLGLLYEDVTRWLGFLHSCDEYKVMALASFGTPRHADVFRGLISVDGDGGYVVAPFDLVELFGAPRERGGRLEQRHYDIAASLQLVLEETVLKLVGWLHKASGARRLAMAGGVALNCVMNARVRDEGPFDEVWVQPAAGDAGTALGAALWVDWTERARAPRESHWVMHHACLGPRYGEDEIERFLRWSKLPYRRLGDLAEETAALLAEDKVIGWFQGRMEFGPRALGARSILASPCSPAMQQRLNEIKDREDFRPVAPVVLEERALEWFRRREAVALQAVVNAPPPASGKQSGVPAPFMLFVFDVDPAKAERIPAVRHVDGTARVQTVRREQNEPYYELLRAFERRTGVPVLVNTSFNTRGEPMICSPRDALETFWTSPLDALVIGPFLIEKPQWTTA